MFVRRLRSSNTQSKAPIVVIIMQTTTKIGIAALLLCAFATQQTLAQCPASLQATVDWTSESITTSSSSGVLSYTATVDIGPGPATIDVTVSISPSACLSENLWKRTGNAHGTGSDALNYKTHDAEPGCSSTTSTVNYSFDHPFGVSQVDFSVLDVDWNGSTWDDIIVVTGTDGTNTYRPSDAGNSYTIVNTSNVTYNSGTNEFTVLIDGNVGNSASDGNVLFSMANNAGQGVTDINIVHTPQGDGRIGLGDITFCVDSPLPVELTSFDATPDGQDVLLRWETATETNNAGFFVEMAASNEGVTKNAAKEFRQLGWVDGYGTTELPQSYAYRVQDLDPGLYTFRLKQIDYDGTFEYHPEVETLIELPTTYFLGAAYPNPFNPQAQFRLSVAQRQHVSVELYNALGQMVGLLYEGTLEADVTRTITIDGTDLRSGMYLYRVVGEAFSDSRPVMLVK